MMLRRIIGLSALAALLPLTAAAADDAATRLLQRIASHGVVAAHVYVGAMPPAFTTTVPLPKAALLGSVTHDPLSDTGFGGILSNAASSVALYYETPTREATVSAYESVLAAAGYKKNDQHFPFGRGGFAPSLPGLPSTWCGPNSQAVSISQPQVSADGIDLTLYAANDKNTAMDMMCNANGFMDMAQRMMPKSPLPDLKPPAGMTVEGTSFPSPGGPTSARVTSTAGIAATLDAFAKQFVAAGWVADPASGSAAARVQSFHKTIDAQPYAAALMVYRLDATHYTAIADATPQSGRRSSLPGTRRPL